jgi:hypothetical protein
MCVMKEGATTLPAIITIVLAIASRLYSESRVIQRTINPFAPRPDLVFQHSVP